MQICAQVDNKILISYLHNREFFRKKSTKYYVACCFVGIKLR